MFTTGGRRLIVRGKATSIPIDINKAKVLGEQGWRWSSHVHPDGTLMSSEGDRLIIRFFRNTRSEIFDLKGTRILFNSKGDMITTDRKPLPNKIRE